MSFRSFFFIITCVWSLGISNSTLSTCFLGAPIDLSVEDNAIALALAECPSRPYAELIKSDTPGPSSLRSTRSAALRPSPPSTMKVPPIRPSATKPTRGELLAQLEMVSRKPWSGKQKTSNFVDKDRLASVKIPKLGASLSSPSTYVHKSERVKAPLVLSSRSHSGSTVGAEGPSGGAIEQPLAVMPITIWNPPTKRVRSPSRRAEEARRKDPKSKIGGDGDSLLHNAELAVGTVSSILKDSDLKRLVALPVDEALALSLQGVTSVSSCTLSYSILF